MTARVPPAPAEHPMQWDEWVGATDAPLGCCYHTPGVGFCQDFPVVAWRWLPCAKWGASVRSPEWHPVCRKHAHGRVSWPTAAQCRVAGQPHRRPTAKPKGPTRTQLRKKCDRLFAEWVRDEVICAAAGYRIDCSDRIQCAHIISRKWINVRWNPLNGLAICSAHHSWFTHCELEWEIWRDKFVGSGIYEGLRAVALEKRGAPDYPAILATLERLVEGKVASKVGSPRSEMTFADYAYDDAARQNNWGVRE